MAQTLPRLITHYRRAAGDASLANADIELEVRFHDVDFNIFETVLNSLNGKEVDFVVGDGAVSHTVNSIMDEDPAMRPPRHRGSEPQKINLIRQSTFDNTARGSKIGERYYRKWPLAPPYRVRNPRSLGYLVALSAEEDLEKPFSSNNEARIRVKCRVSFPVKLSEDAKSSWRIDLTVTRSLRGADAQTALPGAVSKMFRAGDMTPENMLSLLDLTDPGSQYRSMYGYEIEIEHMETSDDSAASSPVDGVRPTDVTEITNRVLGLARPGHVEDAAYQAEIHHVASYVIAAPGLLRRFEHEWGLKKLVPQVVALTRSEYKTIYPPTGYYLLDKADGVRALASVRDGRLLLLADKLHEFYAPGYGPTATPDPSMPGADAGRVTRPTIVDGELVVTPEKKLVFHAFDVIAIEGDNVSAGGYETRVERLADAVGVLRDFGLDTRAKPVVHITASEPAELKAQFLSPVFENRPYETDGRILVEPGKAYSDTKAYKWKSLWNTTIDFLARRVPPSVLGQRPYIDAPGHELHFLFVGINPQLFEALGLNRVPGYNELFGNRYNTGSYFPIQFSPSDAPLAYMYQHPVEKPESWENWTRDVDGKVIELRCAGTDGDCGAAGNLGLPDWQLVRVREDREREVMSQQYFGNDARVAELTWLNYVDPFKEDQLWSGASEEYFSAPKAPMYRAQTAFTSFVKSRRIESSLAHAPWVIEAAIGKGQDFGRYIKASVRRVVGIDQDQGALSELVRRKFSHAKAERAGRGAAARTRRGPSEATTLFALRADLTSPHEDIAKKVRTISGFPEETGADALVINLAIHYLAGSVVNLRNFIGLCRDLVKVGGTVIITTMFGSRVHNLLKEQSVDTNESWDSRELDVLKYSIRRGYAEDTLTAAGQKIGVLLPFSGGEYYDEYLVDVESLTDEFTSRGFSVVGTPTFDEYFDEFRTRNPTMFRMLTEADFTYLRLFGEIILKRKS